MSVLNLTSGERRDYVVGLAANLTAFLIVAVVFGMVKARKT